MFTFMFVVMLSLVFLYFGAHCHVLCVCHAVQVSMCSCVHGCGGICNAFPTGAVRMLLVVVRVLLVGGTVVFCRGRRFSKVFVLLFVVVVAVGFADRGARLFGGAVFGRGGGTNTKAKVWCVLTIHHLQPSPS